MRQIKFLVVHCTATPHNTTPESIQNYWRKNLGWKNPGYHKLIKADGTVVDLLPEEQVSNGVAGHNSYSLHVSYIGGIDAKGRAVDNRTPAQKESLIRVLAKWKCKYPAAKIQGHRDFPGVAKSCPSFNAISEYKDL